MVEELPVNSGSVSLLLPTRGRPELVERFFASLLKTTSRLDLVEVIVYVDEDDTSSHHLDSRDFHLKRIIGPALSLGGFYLLTEMLIHIQGSRCTQ